MHEQSNPFPFDYRRHLAATELRPEHVADFQRLTKDLRYGSPFQILVVECSDEPYRELLIRKLDEVMAADALRSARIDLSELNHPDFASLEAQLRDCARDCTVIHVIDSLKWFQASRWEAFNIRREAVAKNVRARLIFWLDASTVRLMALNARDLWAWRAGLFSFARSDRPLDIAPPRFSPLIDPRSLAQRSKRIAELRSLLNAEAPPPLGLRLPLLDELAGLLKSIGETDEALRILEQEQLPVCEELGDVRSKAVTMGEIADILQRRGQLDEVLRIREHEQLPAYEKFGDVRAKAVTMGKIADILQARGQLDEALRIRKQEELPVYEKLGDLYLKAVCMSKIADILQIRAQFDEAMHIREQEELPVYEKLGDVRAIAVTVGKIANILHARGQFDEALCILEDELLPIFDNLGDVRLRAVTMGYIADILQERGQLGEALRICEREQLPVYEKLGDARALVIGRTELAILLLELDAQANAQRSIELLLAALHDARRLKIPEAEKIEALLRDFGYDPEVRRPE